MDECTALTNRLTSLLKGYYPQALRWTGKLDTEWACDFLQQWPTLQSLQRTRRQQIVRFYERHPRASVDLEQQLIEFEEARPLTKDAAVLEYSRLMVQALIPQLFRLVGQLLRKGFTV